MPIDVIELTEGFEEPGIVSSNSDEKEIFETSDIETETQSTDNDLHAEEEPENLEIDQFRDYFEQFSLQNKKSDFSGRVDHYNRAAFESFPAQESTTQKLARIQRELSELQSFDDTTLAEQEQINNLVSLHEKIETRSTERLNFIKSHWRDDDTGQTDVILPQLTFDFTHAHKFTKVEQKLAQIEEILGNKSAVSEQQKTIVSAMNELYRQIKLLKNENLLSSFGEKLEQIYKNYEESIVGRKAMKDNTVKKALISELDSCESKVNKIYGSYELLQRYEEILPHVIKRMKTLSNMQFEVGKSVSTVKDLSLSVNSLKDQSSKWQEIIGRIEQKLDEQENQFTINKSEICAWLDAVESRIKDLEEGGRDN